MMPDKLDEICLLTAAYTTTTAIKASAYSKGTPDGTVVSYTFCNCQSGGGSASDKLGANHALGIHVTKVGATTATEKTSLKPNPDNKCPDEDSTTELTPIKDLARAICLAQKAKLTTPRPLSGVGYTELQNNDEFKAIASIFLRNGEGQLDPEKDKQQINELIKETYGPNDEHFRKSYVEALDNKKWEFKIIKNKIEVSVSELANGKNAALALAYYASKIKTGCGKQSAHTPIVSNEVEKCKGKPQRECKEEDGCEFKNGECKAKVTKAAETDGKTNTTGSNSFVIKKAPLLLAFLLLYLKYSKIF
uniref:Variant surface glycoprotein 1125.5451 n=1 Tax=Trypanosoma brucei TaxID=5691 RepID=A0A1J0RC67_9TRYP|nr:variant surface glycoprotein 1125.5451 [Trypanosoma brucei]